MGDARDRGTSLMSLEGSLGSWIMQAFGWCRSNGGQRNDLKPPTFGSLGWENHPAISGRFRLVKYTFGHSHSMTLSTKKKSDLLFSDSWCFWMCFHSLWLGIIYRYTLPWKRTYPLTSLAFWGHSFILGVVQRNKLFRGVNKKSTFPTSDFLRFPEILRLGVLNQKHLKASQTSWRFYDFRYMSKNP